MKELGLIIIVLNVSCSSMVKTLRFLHGDPTDERYYRFDVNLMETKQKKHYDVIGQTIYVDTVWVDLINVANKYKELGKVNNNPSYSCFHDSSSTNYVSMNESYVKGLRPYFSGAQYQISYRSIDLLHEGKIRTTYLENRINLSKVESRECQKIIDGWIRNVISERYYFLDSNGETYVLSD